MGTLTEGVTGQRSGAAFQACVLNNELDKTEKAVKVQIYGG